MARKFKLTIDISNDAFQPDSGPELVRILREVANQVEYGLSDARGVYDINGNKIGEWSR